MRRRRRRRTCRPTPSPAPTPSPRSTLSRRSPPPTTRRCRRSPPPSSSARAAPTPGTSDASPLWSAAVAPAAAALQRRGGAIAAAASGSANGGGAPAAAPKRAGSARSIGHAARLPSPCSASTEASTPSSQSLDRRPSLDMVFDGEGTPSAASAPLPSVAAAPAPAPAAVTRKGSKAIFDALAAVHATSPPATEPPAPAPAAEAPRGSSILAGRRRLLRRGGQQDGREHTRPRAPWIGAAEHAARGPLRLDGGGEAGDVAAAAEAGRAGPSRLAAGQQQYLGGVNFT